MDRTDRGCDGILTGLWTNARDARNTETVRDALQKQRESVPISYDPAMVADLAEIGQRYFASAIAPGSRTPGITPAPPPRGW